MIRPKGHRLVFKRPPLHWQCRSTVIPILKSFADLIGSKELSKHFSVPLGKTTDYSLAADLLRLQAGKSKDPFVWGNVSIKGEKFYLAGEGWDKSCLVGFKNFKDAHSSYLGSFRKFGLRHVKTEQRTFPGFPYGMSVDVFKADPRLYRLSKLSADKIRKLEKLSPAQRAAMTYDEKLLGIGKPVSGNMTYNDWLLTQPEAVAIDVLGPGRFRLWKKHKLSMADMVNQKGRPLSIKQLEERLGIVPEKELPSPEKILEEMTALEKQLTEQAVADWKQGKEYHGYFQHADLGKESEFVFEGNDILQARKLALAQKEYKQLNKFINTSSNYEGMVFKLVDKGKVKIKDDVLTFSTKESWTKDVQGMSSFASEDGYLIRYKSTLRGPNKFVDIEKVGLGNFECEKEILQQADAKFIVVSSKRIKYYSYFLNKTLNLTELVVKDLK